MAEEHVYKYSGGNVYFLQGVPARDLTQADVDALEEGVRADLEGHVAAHGSVYDHADQGKADEAAAVREQAQRDHDSRLDREQREAVAPREPVGAGVRAAADGGADEDGAEDGTEDEKKDGTKAAGKAAAEQKKG